MFWALFNLAGALLSIAALNPIPLVATLLLTVIGRRIESPYVAIVEEDGGNPDLPRPDSLTGCAAFLLAVVGFGLLAIIILAALAGILGGL